MLFTLGKATRGYDPSYVLATPESPIAYPLKVVGNVLGELPTWYMLHTCLIIPDTFLSGGTDCEVATDKT